MAQYVVVPLQGVWISGFSPRQQARCALLRLRAWHYDSAIKISSPNCWEEEAAAIGKSSLELSNLDNQLYFFYGYAQDKK